VVLKVLNRLIGRTDSSIDAVNAYVEGSASPDDIKLIEQMMRENPALEKDLTTQRSLLNVLDRVDNIEAPRSFAVTPEMVAAAERSESRLSRFAELFAPQRKLALAPAGIAGIAALSVALLTIGDITGVVDQNRLSGDDFLTTAASAEMESSVAGDVIVTVVVEKAVVTESGAPIVAPEPEDSSLVAKVLAPDSEPEASANVIGEEPPSLAAAPPALIVETEGDEQTQNDNSAVAPEKAALERADDLESGAAATTTLKYGIGGEIADGAAEGVAEGAAAGAAASAASEAGKGISIPLWQLQVALAALVIAAIGAWAGLRRARGE
jgi:hypothetical protein